MKFALSTDEIYNACAAYVFEREGIKAWRFNAEWSADKSVDGKPRLTVWIESDDKDDRSGA